MAVVLVPLVFLDRNAALSEAIIAYVEVPKIALLRSIAALMAILWLAEWGLKTQPLFKSDVDRNSKQFLPSAWLSGMVHWIKGQPTRWILLAAWFFVGTTLLSTVLSASINVSLWGEIPGQDGFPAYTILAYVLLFGVIATHLKSESQLWRLLGAMVLVGVLVSGYGVLQHYGDDFLNLSEATGGGEKRVTSTMGNAVFSAATMLLPIPITLMLATVTLERFRGREWPGAEGVQWAWWLSLVCMWVLILTVQLLGITFTFSRGSWLGTGCAMVAFLGLVTIFVDRWALGRASLVLGLSLALLFAVVQWPSTTSLFTLVFTLLFSLAIVLIGRHDLHLRILQALPVLSSPTGVFSRWRGFGQVALVVGLISALAVATFWGFSRFRNIGLVAGATSGGPTVSSEIVGRFGSIKGEIVSGSLSGRGSIWQDSWRLITERPWVEFDDLSLPWLRPVIGYGPDMLRYTFLLVSTPAGVASLPPEPDHAHNYFIHQTVEQGFLGLFSALGIFVAPFLVGIFQLFRGRPKYSYVHKLVLIGLLATLSGRSLEQMVGVARVSDLTVFWALLAIFVALPAVMESRQSVLESASQIRRGRGRRPSRRRPANTAQTTFRSDWRFIFRLALVASLIGAIGAVTWIKTLNYPAAALLAGQGTQQFQQGEFQGAIESLERATNLAPDVPIYYNFRAAVYRSYLSNDAVAKEWECSLQPDGMPYETCLAWEAYRINSAATLHRPLYWRSRLALADSAILLNMDEKAVQLYQEVVSLVPASWPLQNRLAEAYLEAGQPQNALETLDNSLNLTGENQASSHAWFLRGQAYQDLGQLEESAGALETSLELDGTGNFASNSHLALVEVYTSLGQPELAEEHRQLAQQ